MWTVARPGRGKITEKRSRFLAFVYPVDGEDEAKGLLADLRRRYHDARHIVHAYRIVAGGMIRERADDAGEPARSAGWPLLELLRGEELVNVLVVVVRYFGGVKLGVGNLRRAYRDAASLALKDAGKARFIPTTRLLLSVRPEHFGKLFALLGTTQGRIVSQGFREGKILLTVELPESEAEGLIREVRPWAEARGLE